MKIGFVGYGNMAKAIARGLKKQPLFTISAAAPSLTIGINNENIITHHDNKAILQEVDVLILAVKPDKMATILEEINPLLPSKCLLISIAAGLTLDWFAKRLNPKQALIRSMPNTPATVGLAATPLCANNHTSLKQKEMAESIFSCIGLYTWLENEAEMDHFTAVFGCGPAYVFLFLDALIHAACNLGIGAATARLFAIQTLEGATQLAKSSPLNIRELKENVTSSRGVTAAALQILEPQLTELIFSAVHAAVLRAEEIGQTN